MLFKQDDTATVVDSLPPWKVLIVDDEPDIHSVTKMALRKFRLNDRGAFLSACLFRPGSQRGYGTTR
ncbi:hypothetical protein [Oceanospirillum beijerinckii]|uniref:hypothetical protein n=1 Tax=Oceanospirillum beijerinckii TaxID=64976 RepID=UPI00042416B5|nr:hypothetical protein [Oceanospirillum beijerinckii]